MDRVFLDANVLFSAAYRSDSGLLALWRRAGFLAAMAAQATHLLTGDRTHFGPYYRRTVAGVLILPPSEYLHD